MDQEATEEPWGEGQRSQSKQLAPGLPRVYWFNSLDLLKWDTEEER